jgi:Prp8 binding protein
MDRSILLWNTSGECANYRLLTGHKSAVLDLQWSRDSQVLYSASADAHVSSWNVETGERIRRHVGHEEVINCLDVSRRGEEFLASGGDDGSISLWDPRQKAAIDYIETDYPITALCLGDAGGNELFSGAVDNIIQVWDLRMKKTVYSLTGHADTITSLAISPDGQTLLSNSHDSTVRTWDVRPFAPEDRSVRTLDGAQAGLEKNLIRACWDPSEGKRVAVGGGDGTATVWDVQSGRLLHKLPGHKGTVNDVRISPDGSMSKSLFLSPKLPTELHADTKFLRHSPVSEHRQNHVVGRASTIDLVLSYAPIEYLFLVSLRMSGSRTARLQTLKNY